MLNKNSRKKTPKFLLVEPMQTQTIKKNMFVLGTPLFEQMVCKYEFII
jgi:hypothetical protein